MLSCACYMFYVMIMVDLARCFVREIVSGKISIAVDIHAVMQSCVKSNRTYKSVFIRVVYKGI